MTRTFPTLLLLSLIIFSCKPTTPPIPEHPWIDLPINFTPKPFDIPYQSISVIEIARFTPPDGFVWPAAEGESGRTIILNKKDPVTGQPIYRALWLGKKSAEAETLSLFVWDLEQNTLEIIEQDIPSLGGSPMRFLSVAPKYGPANKEEPYINAVTLYTGGESSISKVTVDDEKPIGLPIVTGAGLDKLKFGSEEKSKHFFLYLSAYELSPEDMRVQNNGGFFEPVFVFQSYIDQPVEMPDGVTRLVPGLCSLSYKDLYELELASLDRALDDTYGSELTGFQFYHRLFYCFFKSTGMDERNNFIFIRNQFNENIPVCAISFGNNENTDDSVVDTEFELIDYFPMVDYLEREIIFGQREIPDNPDKVLLAAMNINTTELYFGRSEELDVLWQTEIPKIFSHTEYFEIRDEAEISKDRPYIACLDQKTGELTIFDPLLGSIRSQTVVDLSQATESGILPSFCRDTWEWNVVRDDGTGEIVEDYRPPVSLFIHDPNSNEIIQLEIETRELYGPSIVPLSDENSE